MMTRKDFIVIAKVIATDRRLVLENADPDDLFTRGWLAANEDLAFDLADALEQANPRFDRTRFLWAALDWERDRDT